MNEYKLNELELENASLDERVSIEEKRAIIKEAKKRYGKDYLQFFKKFTNGGSGIDWNMLRFRL